MGPLRVILPEMDRSSDDTPECIARYDKAFGDETNISSPPVDDPETLLSFERFGLPDLPKEIDPDDEEAVGVVLAALGRSAGNESGPEPSCRSVCRSLACLSASETWRGDPF